MSWHIAYVIPHADAGRGGAEAYLMGLMNDVIEKGHRITLLCQSAAGVPEGVAVKEFPVKGSPASRIQQFWDALDVFLANNHFDIVHSLDLCPRMNIHNPHGGDEGVWLKQYLDSKTGLDKWVSALKRRWGRRQKVVFALEKKLFADSHLKKVIAISPFVKTSIQQHHALPDDKFVLIPNGTDVNRFFSLAQKERQDLRHKYGIAEDERLVIFVAHNFALKGLSSFIKTVATLNKESRIKLKAWVVGQGRKSRYRSLVKSSGLRDILSFKGRMGQMAEVYNVADLTLAPSYYDACSLSTLESLLCGTPVVTTAVNGAHLYIEEGVTGAVAEGPENTDVLAEKSAYFLSPEGGQKARARAADSVRQYSKKSNSEAILGVYAEILS